MKNYLPKCVYLLQFLFWFTFRIMAAGTTQDGLTFYASFDKNMDADADGKTIPAMVHGGVKRVKNSIKGHGVLVGGGETELKYKTGKSLNPHTGTIAMFVCSKGFRADDDLYQIFMEVATPGRDMNTEDYLRISKDAKAPGKVNLIVIPKGKANITDYAVKLRELGLCSVEDVDWDPGEWHHLAVTWGDGKVSIYFDGKHAQSHPLKNTLTGFGEEMFIGGSYARLGPRAPRQNMIIDELRIYDRRLTDSEIKKLVEGFNLKELNSKMKKIEKTAEKFIYKPPEIDIPRTAKPPVIDGVVRPEEWRDAVGISGLINLDFGVLADKQSQFYLTYDKENLYIAMLDPIGENERITASKNRKRDDGDICHDDALEIFLNPSVSGKGTELIQFLGNCYGAIFDRIGPDPKTWQGKWDFKNKLTDTMWSAELSIPFSSLGVPTPENGDRWRFNICRDRLGGCKWNSWVKGTYSDTSKLAIIRFVDKGLVIKAPDMRGLDTMSGRLSWQMYNPLDKGATTRIYSKIYSEKGGLLFEQELEQELIDSGQTRNLAVPTDIYTHLKPHHIYYYEFEAQMGRAGTFFYKQQIPFKFIPPGEKNAKSALSPEELKKKRDNFAKPWRGNKIAIDHSVPPPWHKVKIDQKKIGVWGRIYDFSKGILPAGITALDKQMLALPVSLMLIAGGKTYDLGRIDFSFKETFDDKIILTGEKKFDGFSVSVDAAVEFDGMMRFDYRICPEKTLDIEQLTLLIPVKNDRVVYAHYFDETWASAYSGACPANAFRLGFKRQVWLGDEDRGLAWFTPSRKGWSNKNKKMVAVTSNKGPRTITITMIDHHITIDKPLEFTFGFQATPVKKRSKDWRKWQEYRSYLKKSPKYKYWSSLWRHGTGFSQQVPGDPEDVKRIVADAHEKGELRIFYAAPTFMGKYKYDLDAVKKSNYHKATYLPEKTIENELFYELWQTSPPVDRGPEIAVCPNSERSDYLVWCIKKLIDDQKIDGIYFDNCFVYKCKNSKHGCGYKDRDGLYKEEYPVFAQREQKKRIYKLFKALPKDTLIVDHTTSLLDAPLLSFCDIAFLGENYMLGPEDHYMEQIPLDKMRAEFTCRQWGYIPMLMSMFKVDLKNVQKIPDASEEFFAMVLLHDVIFASPWINHRVANRYFNILHKFNMVDCRFVPYWDPVPVATADKKEIKCSAYIRPGECLLIIGNTSPENRQIRVTLNTDSMGIGDLPDKVEDLFHGDIFELKDGKISCEVKGYNFRALHLKSKTDSIKNR